MPAVVERLYGVEAILNDVWATADAKARAYAEKQLVEAALANHHA